MNNNNETEKDTIEGIIKRVTFHNPINGYGIINVELLGQTDTENNVTVTLNRPQVFEGVTMRFVGVWTKHPKYGKQFKCESCQELPPATKEAIIKYLSSSFFPGIGPSTAKKVVAHFGEDAIDVFRNNISRLDEIKNIPRKKIKVLKESWEEHFEMNNVMIFLQEHNMSTAYSVKIYKQYGYESIDKLKENPYRLSTDIQGIGFAMADKLAMSLGYTIDGEERISAAIHHILSNNQNDGHCYLTQRQIKIRLKKLLGIDVSDKAQIILDQQEIEEQIVCITLKNNNGNPEKRYYSRDIYYDEKYVAEKVVRLSKKQYISNKESLISDLNSMMENSEFKLSDEQFDAVINSLDKGLSILTGGPGCGKTLTVKFVYDMLVSMDKDIMLAAPTGRAAQRMSEVIGEEAKTIHRLLKFEPGTGKFKKCEKDLLEVDYIILDESSMIDIKLAASLFRAISPSTQILLVGDKDQLPSVGPGNIIADLIESKCVPTSFLTKVFRQAESSEIITYAHSMNKGKLPVTKNPLEKPEIWKDGTDCMFINSSMNWDKKGQPFNSLNYGLNTMDMIIKLYKDYIPKYLGKDSEIQILAPMNKGTIGTIEINKRVQEAINPKSVDKNEIIIGDRIFREGDRVIQTSNNYDLNVFNGDIGYITKINENDGQLFVEYQNGKNSKVISYERSDIMELNLAYCITIHKSQGSEFKTVIMPVVNEHYIMLYRNLIYTGITRAKKMGIIIGEQEAFERSIKNIDPNIRQTSLKTFLKENYDDVEAELEFLDF
jgi:exodeoxyribonuclease V alpha subunit